MNDCDRLKYVKADMLCANAYGRWNHSGTGILK